MKLKKESGDNSADPIIEKALEWSKKDRESRHVHLETAELNNLLLWYARTVKQIPKRCQYVKFNWIIPWDESGGFSVGMTFDEFGDPSSVPVQVHGYSATPSDCCS